MNSYHMGIFGSKSTINEVDGIENRFASMRIPPTITRMSPNAAAAGHYQASPRTTPIEPTPNYFSHYQSSPHLPPSLQGSASSLNTASSVPTDNRILLLAMKRCENMNGSTYLVLVQPKTGERYNVEESVLANSGIQLGDFVKADKGTGNTLENYVKKDISNDSDFRFKVKVEGDIAVVNSNKADLIQLHNGPKVFRSKHFGYALCEQPTLKPKPYMIRLVLLDRVCTINGHLIHFRAINPVEFRSKSSGPQTQKFNQNPNRFQNRNPNQFPNQNPLQFPNQNPNQFQNRHPNQTPAKIHRPGFVEKQPAQKVTGAGFSEQPKANVITGKGFTPDAPKNAPIQGRGFQEKKKPLQKSKAVVTSIQQGETSTYYLWLLDKKAEGRFKSKHDLQIGHFFEGNFTVDSKGQYECQEYTKGFDEPLIPGGIEDGQIYLEVKGENYQKTVNQMFATLEAKWIGDILDTESMLTKKEGAKVRIQRKGVAEKQYVWSIIKVL